MLHDTLTLRGYEVFEAADGSSGVETAQRVHPDVVLIDVGSAGLDGHEVARRIRLGDKRLRLVAIAARDGRGDRARALEAGFDEHVVKPVDPQTLETALHGSPHSVGAMARRYDAVQDAVDQVRWARQLRQQSRAARRRVSAIRRPRGAPSAPSLAAGR
jgi:DNA-binding response OmpR family regulator